MIPAMWAVSAYLVLIPALCVLCAIGTLVGKMLRRRAS